MTRRLAGSKKNKELLYRLNEERLQALLRLNEMTGASLKDITDFALEAAVKLTQSKIGYLAFLSADEKVLTMHSWSKSAMDECAIIDKPIVYQVESTGLWGEAVRQRKAVITNDYQEPNPLKKGYPEGHVAVYRHINIPVFSDDQIVLVSGVGNKQEPYDESDERQLNLLMQGMWQLIQRKRVTDFLRLNEARLQAMVDLQQLKDSSLSEITDFTVKAAVKLTQSKLGYVAFISPEDRSVTLHSLFRTDADNGMPATTTKIYPAGTEGPWSEVLQKCQSLIVNDEQTSGRIEYSPNYVRIMRHINIPVFDHQDSNCPCYRDQHRQPGQVCDRHETVVAVAGVSNKDEPYDETDARQLSLFLEGMWQLIQLKRQQEELRRGRDELELRVQERTAELVEARIAAEAASHAKSTFLATMSHEIRTPLNAVIGMTELVLKSQLSSKQREFLLTVRDSGEALLSVINDILDFSKIEAGKLVLEHRTFDLRESLGDTMKSFAIPAHGKGLELTCLIHPGVPQMVAGDYNRLRQIVVNLIGNAIKFTERGEVGLEVRQEKRIQERVFLHFIVNDTGIGVPEEKSATIFKMFEQADGTTTRRHGGTGLGLAIASRLTGLMGGRIWLEARSGGGSSFHFTIQLDLSDEAPSAERESNLACLHGLRVLVVDDNATNRLVLNEVLSSWGMIPDTVSCVDEALAAIQEAHEKDRLYQLIITDSHIPAKDGFTLAEQIKSHPDYSSTIIMMLTSADCPEDIARCKRLGITAYLLKPVKQSELLETIEMALGIVAPALPSLESSGKNMHTATNLRILVAEDSPVNQQLIVALLEGNGHKVTLADNGQEAVAAHETGEFDLIFMDVQMPIMDGFEATAIIRSHAEKTGIHKPIVAMTAYALKGDQERCLEAGMDYYISKPLRAQELFDLIDLIFAQSNKPAEAVVPVQEAVNWFNVLQVAQGDISMAREMMKSAYDEMKELIETITQALESDDYQGLRQAAHRMRGTGWYLGQTNIGELTAGLEEISKLNDHMAAASLAAELAVEVNRILAVLAERGRGN